MARWALKEVEYEMEARERDFLEALFAVRFFLFPQSARGNVTDVDGRRLPVDIGKNSPANDPEWQAEASRFLHNQIIPQLPEETVLAMGKVEQEAYFQGIQEQVCDLLYRRTRRLKRDLLIENVLLMLQAIFQFDHPGRFQRLEDVEDEIRLLLETLQETRWRPSRERLKTEALPLLQIINARLQKIGKVEHNPYAVRNGSALAALADEEAPGSIDLEAIQDGLRRDMKKAGLDSGAWKRKGKFHS